MSIYCGLALEKFTIIHNQKIGCNLITIPPSIINKINKPRKSFKNLQLKQSKVFCLTVKNLNLRFKSF